MGDLFGDYEKQFSILSADITAKIGKVPNLSGAQKKDVVSEIEQKLEEAQELLEQMDLEVRAMGSENKAKYGGRLKSYKDEVSRMEMDLRKAKIAFSDQEAARAELLAGDDGTHSEDQRSRLLENSEKMERSSRRLDDGLRMCIETEDIGNDILQNLERDRETITRTRDRLRTTDSNIGKSSRILSGMMRRIIQNRIILALVCLTILAVIGLVIYSVAKK
ncbi:vesicle transport through interaction with t-SNAREs homolog 1A-like [Rhopilema esculentum]|uniref:vesicle transport through interaction with t-SNAREs homolog 1A-like n=1 Tax=Rhopilema esculentum TaxID=499914 RepID=UPI0031DD79C0